MKATKVDRCQFSGTASMSSAQNSSITNSVFKSLTIVDPVQTKYCEGSCFRKEDHKMFKALDMGCPCTEEIPLQVANCKNGQKVRIYYDDVVFLDDKGEFTLSLRDTMNMVKEQQKAIEKLEKEVKSLKRKSKK